MKGDFTRVTFDPAKRYSRVLKQQGRVDLDADHNEAADIAQHQRNTPLRDIIGPVGVPKDNSFLIAVTPDNTDLTIQPGRIYVDGILCELDGVANYRDQPHYIDLPALSPVNNRTDLVYLDVWERHITAVEDESIREPALGGVDTATRVQTVWQVKVLEGVTAGGCEPPIANFPPPASGALLTTESGGGAPSVNPCVIEASGGYRGLEQRLYRVEIHEGTSLADARFKWSRDNGAVVSPCELMPAETSRIRLRRPPRDLTLGFRQGDWVEVLGDETELQNGSGAIAQIAAPPTPDGVLTLDRAVDAHASEAHLKVRRWDQTTADPTVSVDNGDPVDLEDGIRIRFAGADFVSGDYWVFTARTGSAGLEILTQAVPRGVRHHYARLALIRWEISGETVIAHVQDCRPEFPPLTNICAEDVCYQNDACNMPDVENVQQAIDFLCQQEHECCTIVAEPGPNWQNVFNEIPAGGAHICFRPGEFHVNAPVVVQNRGPLKLTGSGPSTRLIADNGEAVIIFDNCEGATITDLSVRTMTPNQPGDQLNGALTFRNWRSDIVVERVRFQCGSAPSRRSACMVVRQTTAGVPFRVTVENCVFTVGAQQAGLLLVDVPEVQVRGNRFLYSSAGVPDLITMLNNAEFIGGARDLLVRNLFLQGATIPAGTELNATVNLGSSGTYVFRTDPSLVNGWQSLVAADPPGGTLATWQVAKYMKRLANRVLRERGVVLGNSGVFVNWWNALNSAGSAASQAITVGGTRSTRIWIEDNTIDNFIQGIHLGLSHSSPRTGQNADFLPRVVLSNNVVTSRLVPGATRARHGIYVGNCFSLILTENHVSLIRGGGTSGLTVDGVRVFGYLGRMMRIRDNHILGFNVGIRVEFRGSAGSSRFSWYVKENYIPGTPIPFASNLPAGMNLPPNWNIDNAP